MERNSSIVGFAGITAIALLLTGTRTAGTSTDTRGAPIDRATASMCRITGVTDTTKGAADLPLCPDAYDLLSEYFGKGTASPPDASYTLETMIAVLPDPIASHLDWAFDSGIESIRRAFEKSGYVADHFWLPWTAQGDTSRNRLMKLQALAAQRPGVMLFRRTDPAIHDLRIVFVVGETPTVGVHKAALARAIAQHDSIDRIDTRARASVLKIIGPVFSGSIVSLQTPVWGWAGEGTRARPRRVEIISGGATDFRNQQAMRCDAISDTSLARCGANGRVAFHATVNPQRRLEDVFIRRVRDPMGVRPWQVALLREGTTQYGHSGSPTSDGPSALIIPFPMNISSLRSEFARNPVSGPELAPPLGRTARTRLDMRDPATSTENPAIMSDITPPTAELLLDQIARDIAQHHIKMVGILATDSRDKVFLAVEMKKRLRDIQLFVYGSNMLYLRPDMQEQLQGMYVISTYPLFLENQWWVRDRPNRERMAFTSDVAEGTFNATLIQLGNGEALEEYGDPFAPGVVRVPPVWVTTVGRTAFAPVLYDSHWWPLGPDTARFDAVTPPVSDSAARKRDSLLHVRDVASVFLRDTLSAYLFESQPAAKQGSREGSGITTFTYSALALTAGLLFIFFFLQFRTCAQVSIQSASARKARDDLIALGAARGGSEGFNEREALERVVHRASIMLQREFFVLLRFIGLSGAFIPLFVITLRMRAHAQPIPLLSFSSLFLSAVLACLFLAVTALALTQIGHVALVDGRYISDYTWPSTRTGNGSRGRPDLWWMDFVGRFIALIIGATYALATVKFAMQIYYLGDADPLFFSRAVQGLSGVSPAMPLMLGGAVFALWSTWHLNRVTYLSDITAFEEACLAGVFRKAQRHPLRLIAPTDKSTLLTWFRARQESRQAAEEAAGIESAAPSSGSATRPPQGVTNASESPIEVSAETQTTAPAVAVGTLEFKRTGGLPGVPDARDDGTPARRSTDGPRGMRRVVGDGIIWILAIPRAAAERTDGLQRGLVSGVGRFRGSKVPGVEESVRAVRRKLTYLIPTGWALLLTILIVAATSWLWRGMGGTTESTLFPDMMLGLSAFDLLLRIVVLGSMAATVWAIYRLSSVWLSLRNCLTAIADPRMLNAVKHLPDHVPQLTRLTPFGIPSLKTIEDIVHSRWEILQRIYKEDATRYAEADVALITSAMQTRNDNPPRISWDHHSSVSEADDFIRLMKCVQTLWTRDPAGYASPPAASLPHRLSEFAAADWKQHRAEDDPMRRWLHEAEHFVAVYMVEYFEFVLRNLRVLAMFLLAALVLTTLLLSSYPFQSQNLFRLIYFFIVVAGVGTLVTTILQMDRDPLLSCIAGTDAGRTNWTKGTLRWNVLLYGATPIITMVGWEFPPVRDFLFAWITPALHLIAK